MNILELVTHMRVNILDDTGGQGVDWTDYSDDTFDSTQLRWKNEELVRNINEAIRVVYRRTHPVKDLVTLDIYTGTNLYSLPKYVLKILGVKAESGKELKAVDIMDLWQFKDMDTKVGDISKYCPDDVSNTIRIWPTPIIDETISLMVYRSPISELDWTDLDGEPELKLELQLPMLLYATHLCYMKDEANTYDPKRAKDYLDMFDREFPFLSAYSSIRKRASTHRTIKYGGI